MKTKTLTRVKRLALAMCFATPILSWAAEPVAVWDGDFSNMTKGAYTLDENGNTKESGYLQISGDNGITLTSTAALNTFTVIARCEGLNLSAENAQVLFTAYANDTVDDYDWRNLTGVNLPANNAVCRGIWSAEPWDPSSATAGYSQFEAGSMPANYTTLIYNHQQTDGTYAYALGPTSDVDDTVVRTTLYSILGLRSSGTTYHGCNIGGLRGATSETLLPATGLKITSLAVFSGTLTEAEMKGYLFPSEIPVFNVIVSEDKTWSEVLSAAGVTDAEKAKLVITAENNPKIIFDSVDSVLYRLTVNGSAVFSVGDAVYGSGAQSLGKTLLSTTMDLSLPNVTFEVKDGWKGAFVTSESNLKLYAQNAETISINIGGGTGTADTSDDANLVSGSDYYGLYPTPGSAWNNISGRWQSIKAVTLTSAKAFDGETTTTRNTIQLSGTSGNTWQWTGTSVPFLRGYLDDTAGIQVQIVGVPYSQYDVIIYATSDSDLALNYFTINGTDYTCSSDGIATEGMSSWGVGQTTTPTLGKNAMLVQGVTGSTLTISGTRAANGGPRVTVCAVQIINKGVVESSDWSANLNATTSFTSGNGTGLSDQSGTWVNNSLASIILTNKADNATLTLDGEITAGVLKIVGDEGKCLTIDKDSGATFDITVYDLTESEEEITFLFDPDFSKVNAGANLIGVGYDYTGAIGSGFRYIGSENTLTLGDVNGGSVIIGGAGTISGDLGISGDAAVTFSGDYTSSGNVMLGATKGVLNIAEGASVSVPHVRLVNSSSSVTCTMNVDGALTVTSVSSGSNVYSERESYKGLLFGHYYGSSTVNVGETGSIIGEAAWMQLTYTAPNAMTVDGGAVKVRGINGGTYSNAGSSLTLTGGGAIEVAEGFVNMGHITRDYGYGTIKTYSYENSTGWTDSGAITFTDTTNGTTIDPCGMADVFSGALSGAGKIVVSDSVGGGSVSFTGAANNLTGDIVVGSGSTLNLGTTRPTGTMTVDGAISLVLSDKAEVPVLKVTADTVNITLYDTDGTTVIDGATVDYDSVAGTITVKPPMPKWTTQSDSGSFDDDANWSTGSVPTSDDAVVELSQGTTISISGDYTLSSLTIAGTGKATFSGTGTVTVDTVYVLGGTALAHSGQIKATNISLASGTVLSLTGVQEDAAISGAGAVETYGVVTFNARNTFTGGLTVKPGSTASTIKTGIDGEAYGKNNYGQAIAKLSQIVVEDGGSLDLANTKDSCYAITIAGKGVENDGVYSGALFNSDAEIGANSRQTASLTLAADAMVKAEGVGNGWGLVNSNHAAAVLALNGHTLTVSGAGYFPIVNANTADGTTTTGTLLLDGVTLGLVSTASNLEGVDIVAKGCATISIETAPSNLDSLTIKPTATGTTASNWNLPSGFVPTVDVSNIGEPTAGQELTLFTAPNGTTLSASTITAKINGRYTTTISGNTVKATYHADGVAYNFLHYDFNNVVTAAEDSGTSFSVGGEGGSPTFEDTNNGKAVQVHTGYTPYWGTYGNGTSPFHAGEVTVTTLAKIDETNIILWGLGGAAANKAMGLVVTDANTAKVVARKGTSDAVTLVTATVEQDLTSGWHFFAVVSDENGTKLYVDGNTPASTSAGIPAGIGQQGQLGSFHGGAFEANKVGNTGYYLDDWRVYDTALTDAEVSAIRNELTAEEAQEVPVAPGATTEPVGTYAEAEAIAAKTVVAVPEAVAAVLTDEQETAYKALFDAVVTEVTVEQTTKYAVTVELKADVEDGLQDDIDDEVADLAEAAADAASDPDGSKVVVATIPGLYYIVEAGSELDGVNAVSCTLANGVALELEIPNMGTSGFYRLKVSVTPVDVE